VDGSIGRAVGGPTLRVCCWTPTDESGIVVESGMVTSSMTGSWSSSGSTVSMSSGGARWAEFRLSSSESSAGRSSEEVVESEADEESDEDLEEL